MKPFTAKANSKAGYPCTAPRLLNGGGSQKAFTDYGSICCDTTSKGAWKSAGVDAVYKDIDITPCKFTKISYLFTNVKGDGPSIDSAIGASSHSPTVKDGIYRIYLNTKYKFYNAEQYNWRVQWCAYGR